MKPVHTDKAAMSAASMCAVESGRFAIDRVLAEHDGTCVATNGHAMVAIQGPHGTSKSGWRPVLVASSIAENCAKSDRLKVGRAVSAGDEVEYTTKNGPAKIENAPPENERYPEWRELIPQQDTLTPIATFNLNTLIKTLTTLANAIERSSPPKKKGKEHALVTMYQNVNTQTDLVLAAELCAPAHAAPRRAAAVVMAVKRRGDIERPTVEWVHESIGATNV